VLSLQATSAKRLRGSRVIINIINIFVNTGGVGFSVNLKPSFKRTRVENITIDFKLITAFVAFSFNACNLIAVVLCDG
jgi:hypothetical protein